MWTHLFDMKKRKPILITTPFPTLEELFKIYKISKKHQKEILAMLTEIFDKPKPKPKPKSKVKAAVREITLAEDLARDCDREMECPDCDGTGMVGPVDDGNGRPDSNTEGECQNCKGEGTVKCQR
jgi:DnaJ-class molecular chaperone